MKKILQVNTNDGKGWCRIGSEFADEKRGGEERAMAKLQRDIAAWADHYPPYSNAQFRIVDEPIEGVTRNCPAGGGRR